jgi:hypothetical protein
MGKDGIFYYLLVICDKLDYKIANHCCYNIPIKKSF